MSFTPFRATTRRAPVVMVALSDPGQAWSVFDRPAFLDCGEERTMDRYPNISDHGLIGDLQTAALVTTDGVLDWFCCPRFDSPSVFG